MPNTPEEIGPLQPGIRYPCDKCKGTGYYVFRKAVVEEPEFVGILVKPATEEWVLPMTEEQIAKRDWDDAEKEVKAKYAKQKEECKHENLSNMDGCLDCGESLYNIAGK